MNLSAKKIVIDQAESFAAHLENGHANDPIMLARAVAHIIKMQVSVYSIDFDDFVKKGDCLEMHDAMKTSLKRIPRQQYTKIKAGPFSVEGNVTPALIASIIPFVCMGVMAYLLAKTNGWI